MAAFPFIALDAKNKPREREAEHKRYARFRPRAWTSRFQKTRPKLRSSGVSAPGDDHLEVFARNDHGLVAGRIEPSDQVDDVTSERFAAGLIERLESLVHRSVVSAEDVEEVLRRAISKDEVAGLGGDLGCRRSERRLHPAACPPERRRLHAGRRRQVLPDRLEQLADEAFGRPIGEAD